jgi:hypothetical protein
MKIINQISFSTLFALGSFIIGTLFFLLYIYFHHGMILFFGFFYVLAAVFFNLIILVNLVNQLLTIQEEPVNTLMNIVIVLSNIPIAIIYLIIVSNLNYSIPGEF